jgi:hypothetical protein
MLSTQIGQMGSFLVVRQICANSVDHHHDERPVIHVHPIGSPNELVGRVPNKWTIRLDAEVWFVKARHNREAQRRDGVAKFKGPFL